MRSPPLTAAVLGAATGVVAVLVAGAASVASAQGVAGRGWARPVDGPVLRPFSLGPDRFAAGQHRGVDLGAPAGMGVRAACRGRVSFAGHVPRGGRTVSVRCGALVATYQHLDAVAVRRGQTVRRGAPLGKVGHARPRQHVHLGVRVAATGAYLDPLALLAGDSGREPPPAPAVRRPLPRGPAPAARPRLPHGPARVPAGRVQLPRGPAPVPAVRPRLPLGPAPAPAAHDAVPRSRHQPAARPRHQPAARPRHQPAARPRHQPIARPRPATPPPSAVRLPWPVWLGLGLVGLALPLGGFLTLGRRRQADVSRLRTAS